MTKCLTGNKAAAWYEQVSDRCQANADSYYYQRLQIIADEMKEKGRVTEAGIVKAVQQHAQSSLTARDELLGIMSSLGKAAQRDR